VTQIEVPLFPLHTVLFPGGPLQLRIFEPRYLAMVSECLRTDSEFGVVLITQGGETGEAAATHDIGCLARIVDWDQGDDGLLGIRAVGTRRFVVRRRRVQADQLVRAAVDLLPEAAAIPVPERFVEQADWVAQVLPRLEPYAGIAPEDDAGWLSGRLAELLSLKASQRQTLLEMNDPLERLARVASLIDAST
jgi:Lon protease-like protein